MTAHRLSDLAIIVGAMKSGTSTLFESLKDHPQLAACRLKEPCFFASPYRWEEGIEAYEALFGFDQSRHRYAFEATSDYAKFPHLDYALTRMKSVVAYRYKFVYLIRHPVARARSQLFHQEAHGADILTLRGKERLPSPVPGVPRRAIAFSRYAYHIERYEEAFGKGCVLVQYFEDLKDDPQGVANAVCRFLGIDDFEVSKVHSNPARVKEIQPAWQRLRANPAARHMAGLLPSGVRRGLYEKVGSRQRARTTEITEAQGQAMLRVLKDDMIALRDRYGLDVERRWKIDLQAL